MKITDWSQIIGHKSTIRFLRQSFNDDTLQDVILFYGASGLGKSSIAKLLACDIVGRNDENYRRKQIKEVIEENHSTDSIKLFNMSNIKDSEEKIQEVKSDLAIGFSPVGKKVLIWDEAHGMTKAQQDALLVELEHLEKGVYVFICTTEVNSLREALLSRCRTKLPLRQLNNLEIGRLINAEIANRQLTFAMPLPTVSTMISYYANNQPRAALNLLANFKEGSHVSNADLSTFMNTNNGIIIIKLIEYLYGSITLGLDYIETLELDTTFADILIEVTKVAVGGKSKVLSKMEEGLLQTLLRDNDVNNLIRFTIDVTSHNSITKRHITSAFLKNHKSMSNVKPEYDYSGKQKTQDLVTIQSVQREEKQDVALTREERHVSIPSFSELLMDSQIVDKE